MSKVIFNLEYTLAKPPNYLLDIDFENYAKRREFYSMNSSHNYLKYILDGTKTDKNKDVFSYYDRHNKDNQSHNETDLFNLDGKISKEKQAQIKEQLQNSDSTIWHGVISFDSDTTKEIKT